MTTAPTPHGPMRGALIGPWRVQDRVDSGSFGIIFKAALASDPSAGPYALKMAARPDDARFEREAVLLSRVDHPVLPRYHDSGIWENKGHRYPYVVMQWVEGVPLYQWARATGRILTSLQALHLLAQVARALEAIHEHGLHRDVKGDNILVRVEGSAVLLDVGACWLPDGRILTEGALPPGTPQYRSPQALAYREQYRMNPEAHYEASPADDLYALGVTAYRLVTGTYPPEPGGSGRFLSPSALATVAPELEALILRMLSHEPKERGTADELAQALERTALAGESLDKPILPSAAIRPTEHARVPGPWVWRTRVVARAALPLGAVAALMGMMLLAPRFQHTPSAQSVLEVAQAPEALRDGGTSDLADASVELLASTADVPRAGVPTYAIGLPLPKKPFPGQRKPPCSPRSEREVLGACWTVLKIQPPCEKEGYEHEGECLRASFNEPRQPASGEP